MAEGGGKEFTGASRKVGDVDLLTCEEDDDIVRLEKEKEDMYGIVMLNSVWSWASCLPLF